jgi:lysine/ornithine N-monooxygenase
VQFDVAPATIGTRPAATSIVMSITRSHSSLVSVGVSPVVPQGTRKWMPDAICHSTSWRNAFSSMLWSCLKGVMSAVPQPCRFMI